MRRLQVNDSITSVVFHLVRRFFGFIAATPLSPTEQVAIHSELPGRLAGLFFAQRSEDQRHALEVYSRVSNDPALCQAALLHDIGKIGPDLGANGRALATIWSTTSLPVWGRWRTYIEHGRVGADLLEALGADTFAVAFTRYHPDSAPPGVDPEAWDRLAAADEA